MTIQAKEYAGGAAATTLATTITNVSTAISGVDLTTFPTGGTAPFVICLDRGTSSEEKILCTSRAVNTLTVTTRGYDGTTAAAHTSGAVLEHVLDAVSLTDANKAAVNGVGRITAIGDMLVADSTTTMARVAVGATSQILRVTGGSVGYADMVLWVGHTWTLSNPGVPSGATSFVNPKRIRVPSGMTAKLIRADSGIRAGTSVTFDVKKASTIAGITAGTNLTGFTSQSAVPSGATVAPTAVTLADGDYIAPVPSAVTGSPDNFTCDLLIAYTFAG